jgi:hypothetical protein
MTVTQIAPLARTARMFTAVMSLPTNGPKRRGGQIGESYNPPGTPKSKKFGALLGESAFNVKMPTEQDLNMGFSFRLILHYSKINETKLNVNSIEKARAAMMLFLFENRNNTDYYPSYAKFLEPETWVS